MRIDLSDEKWVDFIELDDVTAGDRKKFYRTIKDTEPEDSADIAVAYLGIGTNLEGGLPTHAEVFGVEPTSLDKLKTKDYDLLGAHVSVLVKGLVPNFEPNPSPASPTSSSGA